MDMRRKNNFGDRPNDFVSASGEKIIPKFAAKIDKETGMITLVEVGKENWYEKIQSYKDTCDINRIIGRYMAGEIDILNQVQGIYGDFSMSPKDLSEAIRIQFDLERQFDMLPIDIKQKFDNNPYVWMKDAGSEDWISKMNNGVKGVQELEQQKEKEGVNE